MKKILSILFLSTLALTTHAALTARIEVGYLVDSEEEYFTANVGYQFRANDHYAHHIELEVGDTDADEFGIESDLLPVTLNYRLSAAAAGKFGYYLGAGAGFARARLDGVSIFGPVRLRDEAFAVQTFAGVSYQLSPAAALTVGAKYLWVDDVKFAGTSFEVGDDVALSAGVSFKF